MLVKEAPDIVLTYDILIQVAFRFSSMLFPYISMIGTRHFSFRRNWNILCLKEFYEIFYKYHHTFWSFCYELRIPKTNAGIVPDRTGIANI